MSADVIREQFTRARQGDAAALETALALLRPHLLRTAAARIPDAAACEDVAQDTLTRILRILPGMPPQADWYAYFLMMARNGAVDYIRGQARTGLTENIDLLADELLEASPLDFGVYHEVMAFVLTLKTAPCRILVYIHNRFLYPARYGGSGRHRGFPALILDELGGLTLRRVAELALDSMGEIYAPIDGDAARGFRERLEERENGTAFADMLLRDTLGSRPAEMISMWTDRINRQVMAFAAGLLSR